MNRHNRKHLASRLLSRLDFNPISEAILHGKYPSLVLASRKEMAKIVRELCYFLSAVATSVTITLKVAV